VTARTLLVNGAPVALDGAGMAVVPTTVPARFDAVCRAADAAGNQGEATGFFRALAAGDTTNPTAAITAPADGATVTGVTNVVGTANDANLARYELALARVGETNFVPFFTGRTAVVAGVLGPLDPALFENGLYTLRLTVEDANGRTATAQITVRLQSEASVGLYRLSFLDLQVPLAGIPVTLTRVYDSRIKTSEDFGFGWVLEVSRGSWANNRKPGDGWVIDKPPGPFTLPCSRVNEPKVHVTEIRLSDQEFYVFKLAVFNNFATVGGCLAEVRFDFVSGSTPGAKLDILTGTDVIYPSSGDQLNDFTGGEDTGQTYDPTRVRLTTIDGRVFEFDRTAGLQRLQDANGNRLDFTPTGIAHSASGRSILFQRDGQGRITRITDPSGDVLEYTYDARGDLVRFEDQSNLPSTFRYDARHNLLSYQDPRGNRSARAEYDEAGRLVALTDALGNRREFEHDTAQRREVQFDALGNPTVHEYDAAGNVTATIDALGGRTERTYDARGNMLTETDAEGRMAVMTYDANNNVLTRTDFEGNLTTNTYDAKGRLLTTTDDEGNVTAYTYDADGNVLRVTDPENGMTDFTYDDDGLALTRTDPLDKVTTYTYDAAGNVATLQNPLDHVLTFTHDADGNRLTTTATRTLPGGGMEQVVTGATYDAHNRPTARRDGLGREVRITYAATGREELLVDRNGGVIQNVFDPAGNVLQTSFSDGSILESTYDAEGRELTRRSRDGHTTTYEYDALGRRTKTIHPDASFRTTTYDLVGRVLTESDERGNPTMHAYAPNQETVTDALAHQTVHVFDSHRRRIQTTDARGKVTQYAYDGNGNLVGTTFHDGTTKTVAYDAAGRKTSETDQAGRTTTFAWDDAGRLVSVTDAETGVTQYLWDEVGNLLRITDAEGHATRMEYDAAGRMTKRILPLGQEETFAYDPNGNVLAHTDYNGETTTFTYDANNRVLTRTPPGGPTVTFAYTPEGLRLQAGGDTYAYDDRGKLLTETKAGGDVVTYTYDAAGNRTGMTTAAGTTTYAYDALNRLESVTDPDAGVTTYAYDPVGNLQTVGHPNGVETTYVYDDLNRLTEVTNEDATDTVLSRYVYTLGPAGNRLQVVESGTAVTARTVTYEYDQVYRLTRETIDAAGTANDQDIAYTYDAVGNRLTKEVVQGDTTTEVVYAYDDNDRLVSEATTITVARGPAPAVRWALAGFQLTPLFGTVLAVGLAWRRRCRLGRRAWRRLVGRGTVALVLAFALALAPGLAHAFPLPAPAAAQSVTMTSLTYAYDANGNLLSRTDGTETDAYEYDGENRLVMATVEMGQNPGTVGYGYDADGMRTSQTVNGVLTEFVTDKQGPLAHVVVERTGAAVTSYVHGADLVSQERPGTGRRFYQYDGMGSTRLLTAAAGAVTDTYTYDAFGVLLASTGTTANLYLYRGEQLDPNVGFYYLRARYYAQSIGRFLTTDPAPGSIFDPVSLHRYLYANADPVNKSDPSGRFSLIEISFTVAVIGFVITSQIIVWNGGSATQGIVAGLVVALLLFAAVMCIGGAGICAGLGGGGGGGGGTIVTNVTRQGLMWRKIPTYKRAIIFALTGGTAAERAQRLGDVRGDFLADPDLGIEGVQVIEAAAQDNVSAQSGRVRAAFVEIDAVF
jgi:RHS repeat-associated protein